MRTICTTTANLERQNTTAIKQTKEKIASAVSEVVKKEVCPRLEAMVTDMKQNVTTYLASYPSDGNDLATIKQMITEVREDVSEVQKAMTTMQSGQPACPRIQLTEQDVDRYLSENELSELIVKLGKANSQKMVVYTMKKIKESDIVLGEVSNSGLLIVLMYLVGMKWMVIEYFVFVTPLRI